ncbi:MAG: hypothetical protein QM661_11630 [Solimonas sp.]
MKTYRAWTPLGLLLAAGIAAPACAQEATDPSAVPPAADGSTPSPDAVADTSPADTSSGTSPDSSSGSDAAAGDGSTSAPDAAGSGGASGGADTAAADGESSEGGGGSREPRYIYGGIDYAFVRTSLSKASLKNALGGDEFDSDFYRLRVGTRLFPSNGVEAQFGVKNEDGNDAGKVETSQMYGLLPRADRQSVPLHRSLGPDRLFAPAARERQRPRQLRFAELRPQRRVSALRQSGKPLAGCSHRRTMATAVFARSVYGLKQNLPTA